MLVKAFQDYFELYGDDSDALQFRNFFNKEIVGKGGDMWIRD